MPRRLFSLALLLCAACASSGSPRTTTGTGSAATASGIPLASLRDVDWPARSYPGLDLSADDELSAPRYGDIDGDGREEAVLEGMAIIPDGNSYVTYVYVFALPDGASEPTLLGALVGGDRADGSLRVTGLDAQGLHLARAILGPDDAMCCPSSEQHETWTWDGAELVEDASQRRVEPTDN